MFHSETVNVPEWNSFVIHIGFLWMEWINGTVSLKNMIRNVHYKCTIYSICIANADEHLFVTVLINIQHLSGSLLGRGIGWRNIPVFTG